MRLVQRLGKVPIAVAREAARGEMRNDHQVEYLADGDGHPGRVVVLEGDLHDLASCVDRHPEVERTMLAAAAQLPGPTRTPCRRSWTVS